MLVSRNPFAGMMENLSNNFVKFCQVFSDKSEISLTKWKVDTNFQMPIVMNDLKPSKIDHKLIKFWFEKYFWMMLTKMTFFVNILNYTFVFH